MGLKDILTNSSNRTYTRNRDLLERHGLVNVVGSPNNQFLKFLKSRNIDIARDEITEDMIREFEDSIDFLEVKTKESRKHKEIIFTQRKVWISICSSGRWQGTDLFLEERGITIEKTHQKILYSRMLDIEISDGGWSKNTITILTLDGDVIFTINENYAVPLKEIIEDNMHNVTHDEVDDLLELYELFEWGLISEEEFERRKDEIYNVNVYCTNCGFKLDPGSDFCSNCGYKVLY